MPARPSPTRRLHIGTAAAATGLVLVLGGCSTDSSAPQPSRTTTPAPSPTQAKPLLTVQQADQLDRYQQVNNAANAKQDAAQLCTVEDGATYEQSRADFKQWPIYSEKEKKEYADAWTYAQRTYFIPEQGKASWFLMCAYADHGGKISKEPSLVVFDSPDGAGFKLTASVHGLDTEPPLPQTSPDVLALLADPAAKSGPLAPVDVTAAFEDLYATGGRDKSTGLDRTTESAEAALKIYTERDKEVGPKGGAKKFFPAKTSHAIYALKTREGVLTLVPLAHTMEVMVTRPGLQVDPSPVEALFGAKAGPVITDEFHGQAAAYLPAQGSAQVLGFGYTVTGAH
ncbi:MAG TPA: hypothetical protein VN520_32350 [Streptomyces sp.]|uniref:hypothetical protein n=1 Tax=Streptomyces sp. TaxID=1931 RepID=UPI002CE7B4B5|nr:hypothetical protein [Streptomyces sp.]HWU10994.1 hypothetical protein [Streptomyces sp.]